MNNNVFNIGNLLSLVNMMVFSNEEDDSLYKELIMRELLSLGIVDIDIKKGNYINKYPTNNDIFKDVNFFINDDNLDDYTRALENKVEEIQLHNINAIEYIMNLNFSMFGRSGKTIMSGIFNNIIKILKGESSDEL